MAKAFRFRLDTLMRVREIREREAKRRVGAKRAEIARVDAAIRETGAEIARASGGLSTAQQKPELDVAELARERAWIAHLRRIVQQQTALRAALEQEHRQLLEEMRQAHVQLRIIQKLRERRWTAHQHERALREMAESDELARNLLVRRSASDGEPRPFTRGELTVPRAGA